MIYDYIVVGGGIIGLSTAMHLGREYPQAKVLLLEKEPQPAQHQTGRNSGVIHSGIYYQPGSFKARFAREGAESMARFCAERGIPHAICGKLIVAIKAKEMPQLEALYTRGLQNGVPVEKLSPEAANEIEPHVHCLAALHVRSTGITSYPAVCDAFLREIQERGGEVRFEQQVTAIHSSDHLPSVETADASYSGHFVINCAGLHSDRLARASGVDPRSRIVPFRGEYFELVPERRSLVRGLIYPVPDPAFPFLGVHFTRMIDGSVHAGPNAVLALAREGYQKTDLSPRDLAETLTYSGFWRLLAKHHRQGMAEVYRSLSKGAFTRSLQQLIPAIREEDLQPCPAGIRAQALTPEGKLVDDFLLIPGRNTLHVCNAPSPAATASLQIGAELVRLVPKCRGTTVGFTSTPSLSRTTA